MQQQHIALLAELIAKTFDGREPSAILAHLDAACGQQPLQGLGDRARQIHGARL